MVAQMGRRRGETDERWRKALARALEAGLEVFVVADTGERMVTSASKFDVLHRTDGRSCTCDAALAGDPVCTHRAVVRSVLGWFNQAEPEPATVECAGCRGKGWNYEEVDGGRRFPEQATCRRCGGTGRMPVRIRTIRPMASLSAAAD